MKFLLIGNGFIAPKHEEAIKSVNGRIAGVVKEGDDWKVSIKNTDADCVVILTPNDLHFRIAKFAAESGKIVLCEKPLAIKSEDAEELAKYPNIFTILQLRHHPHIKKIKSEAINTPAGGINKVEMDISVFRDENYYAGWKGQKERSGGVLLNLGIHYFDLLIHLFGEPKTVVLKTLNEKTGTGTIEGDNYVCNFRINTGEKKDNQRRVYEINGKYYNLSSQDNLSFENLHQFVYKDLLKNKGTTPKEALKSIKLVEDLYNSYEKQILGS